MGKTGHYDELFEWVLHEIRDTLQELRREALKNPSMESVSALREYLNWIKAEMGL